MHEQHYASLEIAIQKVKEFSPEQQNKVIEFIELLEFKGDREPKKTNPDAHKEQYFFELAGLWENKDITKELGLKPRPFRTAFFVN